MTHPAADLRTCPAARRDTGVVDTTMTDLRDAYVWRVNAAVPDDRTELIRELNEAYVEEALRRILDSARD